jgi:hypothetical protein
VTTCSSGAAHFRILVEGIFNPRGQVDAIKTASDFAVRQDVF